MHLVRLRRKVVNLEYLILAEEWEGGEAGPDWGPGCVRLTLETGRVVQLGPDDGGELLRRIDSAIAGAESKPAGPVRFEVDSDPPPPPSAQSKPAS